MIMRSKIVLALLFLCVAAAGAFFALRAPARPNVVLVIIDTLRADKLGAYGNPSPASQELDRLAAEGVVLEQVVAQASWTRSSVAAMLTGLYPRRLPVIKEQWDPLPSGVESLAEVLKRNGYFTIGLTANPQLNVDFKFEQGFDRYVESSVTFSWMKDREGKEKAGHGHAVRSADDILGQSLSLLTENRARPVYLQLLLMDVHAHHRITVERVDPDLRGFPDSEYLQAVRNATLPLADFIPKAKKILGENTIFVVTSDHGEGLKDHPAVENSAKHGNLLYRSHLHVPLIVLGPTELVGKPAKLAGLVELIDLFPTVTDLAGVRSPSGIDGASVAQYLRSSSKIAVGSSAVSETRWRKGVNKIAVTDGESLLVENRDGWPGTAPEELYGFAAPQNGAADSTLGSNPQVASRLREELARFEGTGRF